MADFLNRFYEIMIDLQKKKNVEENLSKIVRFLTAEVKFQSLGIFLLTPGSTSYRLKISRNISHHYAKATVFTDGDNFISNLKKLQPLEFENDKLLSFEKSHSHLLVFPLHNNKVFLGFLFIDIETGKFSQEDYVKAGLAATIVSIIVELETVKRSAGSHKKPG